MILIIVLPDLPTEDRLLARARRGDQEAVVTIYDQYFEPLYGFIRLRVDDPALAEDLTGDVFLRLVAALRGGTAPHHSLRGWLFRVARNILHDHYGQAGRVAETALEEWVPAPDEHDPEARALAALDAARVRSALRDLPGDQQEVLLLRFGQMLSLQETAAIMGKGVGAVKSLQFRATSNLRQVMAGSLNEVQS
jgi:RNA polymerase sigma-70 factor (ECF subfamily)